MTKDNVLHFAQTFKPTSNHYYAAENINLNEVKLGYRSRGSREPIKSQGIIATIYSNGDQTFLPLRNMKISTPKGDNNWNSGYIGVDKNGKFVAGNYLDIKSKADHIKRGAVVASTPYCRIYDFDKDAKGKFITSKNPSISRTRRSPVMTIDFGDNKQRKAPINIMLGRNGETNTYGELTGGRIIFKCGDEIRLVSGSMGQIYSVFQDMKKRHKAKYVESYQLDNGTFNKAIRTRNGILDSETLRMYDLQNETGGNGLYLK